MPGPLGLTAWPGTTRGMDRTCRWQGLVSPRPSQDCLLQLCYKPDLSPDLCSMFRVEETCPLQELGLFPCLPDLITASPGMGTRQVESQCDSTPPAPVSAPGGAGFGPNPQQMLSYHQPQGDSTVRGAGRETGLTSPCLPASFLIFSLSGLCLMNL